MVNPTHKKSILIVGLGSIGERHLRCFQATERCVVSGCEPNKDLRDAVQSRYDCECFASQEEALSSSHWDAAVICTPANSHIPIAIECIKAGLQLLIEKPLSISLDEIDTLTTLALRREAIVRVAYVYRSIPVVAAARDLVHSGKIGEIKHVVVTAGQNFPAARPAYASTYFASRSTGGGCIQDALTHNLHAVEWIVGPIEKVFCDASHQALKNVETEDTVNLLSRLQGGVPAVFSLNLFQAPDEVTLSFHGLGGSVRAELHNHRVGSQLQNEREWKWTIMPKEERDGMFIRQANAFLNALEGKPDHLATLEDGLQTLKVNLAAMQSADTRIEVHVQ